MENLSSLKGLCLIALLLTVGLGVGCGTENQTSAEVEASRDSITSNRETEAQILSAYHGLEALPTGPAAGLSLICRTPVGGKDGMPVIFSTQLNSETVSPKAFAVETSSGDIITPICATLRPATDPLELRTVLLIGSFSNASSRPQAVEIVGQLEDVEGHSLVGLRLEGVTPLEDGPSLVLAERFAPDRPELEGECPDGAQQAIQLTWQGGVTGPQGADLAEPQRLGLTIHLENGDQVHPIYLGDDDPDNHVIACLAETSPAVLVEAASGLFHDPGDDANPETSIEVLYGP